MGARSLTAQKRAALAAYAKTGTITHAMRAVQMARRTWYDWIDGDPEFEVAAAQAKEAAADRLEEAAMQRATATKAPSDLLLIFLLKGMRPEKYRERVSADVTGKIEHEVSVVELRQALAQRLERFSPSLLTAGNGNGRGTG